MKDREKLQKWIKEEAESFFEFSTDKRERVTYTSCLLFAEHVMNRVLSREETIKELSHENNKGTQ